MKITTGLIVKSNQVIEAGYELSTSEQRLILSAIERIPKNMEITGDLIFEISATSFTRLFGVHQKTAYRDLKEAANKLYERSIIIRTKEKTTKIRWLQMLEIKNPYPIEAVRDSEWQSVLICFSEAITPLLSNLKTEFTKYLASDLQGLSSAYAIRFYELIKQYESIGKRTISISDLRFMFALEGKYPLFGNLQQRVIDPAIREINENTPMEVQYSLRKTGRKYTHLELTFKQKKAKKEELRCPQTIDMFEEPQDRFIKMSDAQLDVFSSKLADLGEVQTMANVGEEMPAFKARLRSML